MNISLADTGKRETDKKSRTATASPTQNQYLLIHAYILFLSGNVLGSLEQRLSYKTAEQFKATFWEAIIVKETNKQAKKKILRR